MTEPFDIKAARRDRLAFLYAQVRLMERRIEEASEILDGNDKEHAALTRLYIPMVKEFLKLCAEVEREDSPADALTEFTSKYDNEGLLFV